MQTPPGGPARRSPSALKRGSALTTAPSLTTASRSSKNEPRRPGPPGASASWRRARALASTTDDAEKLFIEAISYLQNTSVATDLAHTHLLYGEWLRRENRRQDARSELKAAYDKFSGMGAEGFARRAQIELEATGEKVRRRSAETQSDLTPQEAQVARMAAGGATNPEIAASMFISANTVDYHLRKIFPEARHHLAPTAVDHRTTKPMAPRRQRGRFIGGARCRLAASNRTAAANEGS